MCIDCGFCCRATSTIAQHMRVSKDGCRSRQAVATQQLFGYGVLKKFLKVQQSSIEVDPATIDIMSQWDSLKKMKGNADVNDFDPKHLFQSWKTCLNRAGVDGTPELLVASANSDVISDGMSSGLHAYMECKQSCGSSALQTSNMKGTSFVCDVFLFFRLQKGNSKRQCDTI